MINKCGTNGFKFEAKCHTSFFFMSPNLLTKSHVSPQNITTSGIEACSSLTVAVARGCVGIFSRFKSTNPHHVLECHVLESLLLRALNMFKEPPSVATCVSFTPLTGTVAVWFEINNCFGHVWSHLKFMVVDRKPSKVHKTPLVYILTYNCWLSHIIGCGNTKKVCWSAPHPYQHMVIKPREQGWESWKKEGGGGQNFMLQLSLYH